MTYSSKWNGFMPYLMKPFSNQILKTYSMFQSHSYTIFQDLYLQIAKVNKDNIYNICHYLLLKGNW